MNNGRQFGNFPVPGGRGMGAPGAPVDHTWLIVFGEVMHFVLVLLVLATVLLALRMWVRARVSQPVVPSGLAELAVLYARGEVTRDEYLARRADLEHPTS